jgi:hypothetical protein
MSPRGMERTLSMEGVETIWYMPTAEMIGSMVSGGRTIRRVTAGKISTPVSGGAIVSRPVPASVAMCYVEGVGETNMPPVSTTS